MIDQKNRKFIFTLQYNIAILIKIINDIKYFPESLFAEHIFYENYPCKRKIHNYCLFAKIEHSGCNKTNYLR